MPIFNRGEGRLEQQRQEAQRTLSGQINSLTFVERAAARSKFTGDDAGPLGLLLNSASNSLLFAGVTKRTVPRLYIGSASGWEYQQQIAVSGGQGSLNLVFNPAQQLHRELMAPPKDAQYHIVSFTAPPYMNCVAGVYDHLSSEPVALSPEEPPVMPVSMLDNLGAEYVPARFYQMTGRNTTDRNLYNFDPITGGDEPLVVRANPAATQQAERATVWTDRDTTGGGSALIVEMETAAPGPGTITLKGQANMQNLSATGNTIIHYDLLVLLHIPGAPGGYVASPNLRLNDFTTDTELATDETVLARRMLAEEAPTMYLGIYATASQNLLFRT